MEDVKRGRARGENSWEIRDPIHGYIRVNELEKEIIDNRFLQRLKRIKQLGLVHVVYPGGEHSRFTHSLGTMHVAGLMGKRLESQGVIDEDDVQVLRLAGLIHDVGHGPFSHVFEDLLHEKRGMTHEDLTIWIVENTELKDILERGGYDAKKIAEISVGRYKGKKRFLNDVMVSGFCADILDYLERDSYHTGVEYGRIDVDRITNSVIALGDQLAIDATALYALESLIIARYEMFRAVYFHRTVRAATIMIREVMFLADAELGLTSFSSPGEYYRLVDEYVISSILDSKTASKKLELARDLLEKLLRRELLKSCYERVFHTHDTLYSSLIKEIKLREAIIGEIAELAEVEREDVYLDFPTLLSVPHYPLRDFPTYVRGEITPLTSISHLVSSLSGYMNVLRVYTWESHRERVTKASESVLGKPHFTLGISY